MEIYLGLISGTSMDGIDAVLVDLAGEQVRLLSSHTEPLPPGLREQLAHLAEAQEVSLDALLGADVQLGRAFARAADVLLTKSQVPHDVVRAIGSHGQTVRHLPNADPPATLQIGDPNVIAELTGIRTVADFRRRDMAAGGQGAPLAPAFHAAQLATRDEMRVVLNIGGIANITVLAPTTNAVVGFDTGPGNGLMDRWSERHLNRPFDEHGNWARQGVVNGALLDRLLEDPYFAATPPKSTGREYFNLPWLERKLRAFSELAPVDVQRSLCELTARTIADAIGLHAPDTATLIVAGGGVHNGLLLERIRALNPALTVHSSAHYGMDPDWLEAMAFAWLAKRRLDGERGTLSEVTGAAGPRVLGGVFAPTHANSEK